MKTALLCLCAQVPLVNVDGETWFSSFFRLRTTGLKNVCACAACHGARSLGITTSHIKIAAFSKFCEWPPVFREKVEFARKQ